MWKFTYTSEYFYEIDKETSTKVHDLSINNEREAQFVTDFLTVKMNIPKISVCFVDKTIYKTNLGKICFPLFIDKLYVFWKLLKKETITRTIGTTLLNQRIIVLYNRGKTIVNLLHEIAHLLPNSRNHEESWENNYRKLVEHYKEFEKEYVKEK